MKSIKEYIRQDRDSSIVGEAVRSSELHVHFDDAKQEFKKNAGRIFQEILKDAVSEKRFQMMLSDTLYNILNAKKLPYGDRMQEIAKKTGDDGSIDKQYAVEFFRLAVKSVLYQIGLALQNQRPFDFNFPDKIVKASVAQCCPSCRE